MDKIKKKCLVIKNPKKNKKIEKHCETSFGQQCFYKIYLFRFLQLPCLFFAGVNDSELPWLFCARDREEIQEPGQEFDKNPNVG